MWARDGALVRLRVPAGQVRAAALGRLVPLVTRHAANGLLLTRRAKLEARGVAAPATFIEALEQAGWLETPAEAALPDMLVCPVAGPDRDTIGVYRALRRALLASAAPPELADKFMIVVDAAGPLDLADVAADIRLDATTDGRWRLALGGDRETATVLGALAADELPAAVTTLIERFVAVSARADTPISRMRALDAPARERLTAGMALASTAPLCEPAGPRGQRPAGRFLGFDPGLGHVLGFAFGRIPLSVLEQLADGAGDRLIRLLPDRRIIVPTLSSRILSSLRQAGAIDDPADARLGLAACIGCRGCTQGTTDTRADALALARDLPEQARRGLHVSGCPKGCAWRGGAPITLVARDGRYDLVRNGDPDDTPNARGLDLAAVRQHLADID